MVDESTWSSMPSTSAWAWTATPPTLDVHADAKIRGSLTVNGTALAVDKSAKPADRLRPRAKRLKPSGT